MRRSTPVSRPALRPSGRRCRRRTSGVCQARAVFLFPRGASTGRAGHASSPARCPRSALKLLQRQAGAGVSLPVRFLDLQRAGNVENRRDLVPGVGVPLEPRLHLRIFGLPVDAGRLALPPVGSLLRLVRPVERLSMALPPERSPESGALPRLPNQPGNPCSRACRVGNREKLRLPVLRGLETSSAACRHCRSSAFPGSAAG